MKFYFIGLFLVLFANKQSTKAKIIADFLHGCRLAYVGAEMRERRETHGGAEAS